MSAEIAQALETLQVELEKFSTHLKQVDANANALNLLLQADQGQIPQLERTLQSSIEALHESSRGGGMQQLMHTLSKSRFERQRAERDARMAQLRDQRREDARRRGAARYTLATRDGHRAWAGFKVEGLVSL